ncbi:bifunctional deaminase-reductase domain protein [Microbacterium laevaniformans OR221]|nr:bifunctional deaminase-reductase domain protein [Microbacterium laevaniformans OR221]
MSRVRLDLNISIDGFATTTDQTPENPFGEDWGRLTRDYTATRTFRERVLHDDTGAGTTGIDDAYAQRYFADLGAEIMGAGMFGLHEHGDDPQWRGWWGDEPPRIGGGGTTARSFLDAGLVDDLHVAVVPIVLGRGIRLWDDLRGLENGYEVRAEAAESGVTHLTFRR